MNQVGWNDQGWYGESWDESAKAEPEAKPDESEKKTDNPVGSLILHAVTDHGSCCGGVERVGSLVLHDDIDHVACDVEACVQSRQNVPWFQPLKGPDVGHDLSDLDGLLCTEPRRVQMHSPLLDVGFGVSDTVCNCRVVSQVFSSLCPILAELSFAQDPTWWLIDSGAAVTVVAESNFHHFQSSVQTSADSDRFRAANGSKVSMKGIAEISLGFSLMDVSTGKKTWKTATLNAMVGNTQHNILSTTALCRSGWTFSQWSDGAELKHDASGQVISGIVQHSGCPWVRLQPEAWGSVKSVRFDDGIVVQDVDHVNLSPLSPAVEAQLETHRKQGHFPHHPQCTECAKARSVFRHRRRGIQNVECEVQADFCFLSRTGEVVEGDLRNKNMKILVLTEMLSGCVGYVLMCDNRQRVNGDIERWLDSFGLMSNLTSVVLHTDDEKAVGDIVGKSTRHYLFQVRRAAPQQHRSIGGAERAVRKLKESLAVVRGDLNRQGLDIQYSYESVRDVITFLALMNNHFGRSGGTDLSPLETSAGRPLSKPVTSMFGATVIAEIPDSIRQYSPNESRSIEAAYVHPGVGTGAAVEGWLRVDGRLELRRFYARNVREVAPLAWNVDLCRSFLSVLDPRDDGGRQGDRAIAADDGQGAVAGPRRAVADARVDVPPSGSEPSLSKNGGESDEVLFDDGLSAQAESPGVGEEEVSVDDKRDDLKRSPVSEGDDSHVGKRSRTYLFTPGCPSSETGMNAPGIRHSAACKRRQNAEFSIPVEEPVGPPVFQPQPVVLPDAESQRSEALSRKRSSDVSVERLEEEIKQDGEHEAVDISSLIDGLWWHGHCCPMNGSLTLSFMPATAPDFFEADIASIKFRHGESGGSEVVNLCGKDVLLWRPLEAVDDSTLVALDPDLTVAGMREELENMSKCQVGVVLNQSELDQVKQECPHLRVIQARWVTAFKSAERVRARLVAKDLRTKDSARSLGCSSPTPSCEVVNLILALTSSRGWRLRALDISHAFMHSPLPRGTRIALKLPQSVSSVEGLPLYLDLLKSLNGLRDASLHWLQLLQQTIAAVGLWSDEQEPCAYQGHVFEGSTFLGTVMLLCYVDDLLLCSSTKLAEEKVVSVISGIVPTKTTSQILGAKQGGGMIQFIGRIIERFPHEDCLYLSVSPSYLDTTFRDYQIEKGSRSVPDVSIHLEKTDENSKRPLSPESYSRFRRALPLGRLLWLAQVRVDVKTWLSLLGSQQSAPTQATEAGLRAVLRFLKTDCHVVLRLPSRSELLDFEKEAGSVYLHLWADASHAPYRFNKRKGISGQVMFFEKSLVRAVAKQQQATSLSSCESELYSIQQAAQDAVSVSKVLERLLLGIGETAPETVVNVLLESDSASALQLIHGVDIPKKSRHIEIRLLWIRSQIERGVVRMKHRAGSENVSDLFTKCLSSQLFFKHRETLGFEERSMPDLSEAGVTLTSDDEACLDVLAVLKSRPILLVELCCSEGSALNVVTKRLGVRYVGVTQEVQSPQVFSEGKRIILDSSEKGFWVHIHASTPCSSGSPLKHLSEGLTDSDLEWSSIISSVGKYFDLGHSKSFELPFHNQIWNRDETKKLVVKQKMSHSCQVFLCQMGCTSKGGKPIGKSLCFVSTHFPFVKTLHKMFGLCTCQEHAAFSEINYTETAFYPQCLARALIRAVVQAMRDP